jgi:hypothetical protein
MLINKYFEEGFWDDMSPKAQDVANKMYEFLIKRKDETIHPETSIADREWHTIVHNVSLLSAWAIDDDMPDTIIDSGLVNINPPEN